MQTVQYNILLTKHYVQAMYNHYLHLYQRRYLLAVANNVTWKKISYWRKQVTYYGRLLICLDGITEKKYRAEKNTCFGGLDFIKNTQQQLRS